MKKKLLITLGCSFTEGVGCYDPELVKQYKSNNLIEIDEKSIERFHANGWPARLQKKLNYDKLINLGKRGTGESFHLKRFIEEFSGVDLTEKYDVLVVWMTSPQGRLSFYVDGTLYSILSNWAYPDKKTNDISTAYARLIENVELDTCLEQAFYVKALKEICNGKNYNFLVFPLGVTVNRLHELLNIPEDMAVYYKYPPHDQLIPDLSDPQFKSLMNCGHPNENGYELIAERMFDIIKKHNDTLINNTEPLLTLEQEWPSAKHWKLK